MRTLTRTRTRRAKLTRKPANIAPVTTTAAGITTYRTRRPLTEAQANTFAKMVTNNGRFLQATVVKSRKVGHFHVCFMPSNIDRIVKMIDTEDAKDRAAADRDGKLFVYSIQTRPQILFGYAEVWKCEGVTGNYETTLCGGGACTCPHYKYRRAGSGGECKHIKELRSRKEAGLLAIPAPAPKPAPVRTTPGYGSDEWNRRVAADF